ncbi:MAG: carboxyl transferase domain-containing protein [Candidatus Sericytochromatia bacterium]
MTDKKRLLDINKSIEQEKKLINSDKLNPRQRLSILFDNGEYKELFKFAGFAETKNLKDGIICAFGNINNRPATAYAFEFEYQGGSVGALQSKQIVELYRLARQSGLPVIALNESGGARLTDAEDISEGYADALREAVFCSGFIPQITATFGVCIGASAFMATLSDFVIMEKDSSMCISGASVNKVATGEDVTEKEMGGIEIHTKHSGSAHFIGNKDKETIEIVRKLLNYLPSNNSEKAPITPTTDPEDRIEESVNNILPQNMMSPFDIKKLINLFVDDNNFFEVQKEFAPNIITGFARFGGISVGIVANQSNYLAGAFDSKGSRKMARFVNFLSTFNFPMITFVDVPGAIPTVKEHKEGILLHGAQVLQALGHHKHLKISIVVRKCFGGAYCMINPKSSGGDIIYAYPEATIGIMSDQAMTSVVRKDSPLKQRIDKIHSEGGRIDGPLFLASKAYIDDIIEPSHTRIEIIKALKTFGNKTFNEIPNKWMNNQQL